jgi:hypothetical protein
MEREKVMDSLRTDLYGIWGGVILEKKQFSENNEMFVCMAYHETLLVILSQLAIIFSS